MPRPSTATPAAAPATSAGHASTIAWCAALVLGVLLVYLPAVNGAFLWDDDGHVTRADLRSWSGLFRIWFEVGATQQYYPILHTAFWLEHALWGDAVVGYHLVNILQHAANACLFGFVLQRLSVPGARWAAALFAFHPVCVESVAWISEQKNTLSLFFYLAAALGYLRYEEERTPGRYLVALGLFLLAILTKTVAGSLPAALLVIAWWRRGRIRWKEDVMPLLPWFGAAAAMGLLTAHFEHELIGAKGTAFELGLVGRLLLAARVPWFYLGKLVWPAELIFIYPRWTIDPSIAWQWFFPVATLSTLGAFVWLAARGRRAALAAALLFGGSLFPVLGFVNVFPFLFSYVADHFQYLASLALFALAGAGIAWISVRAARALGIAAGVTAFGALIPLTVQQAAIYRDEATLWNATLEANPDCWLAHNNLALVLAGQGEKARAIDHLEVALRLRPNFPEALNNLAGEYVNVGRAADGLRLAERALELLPRFADALNTRGRARLALGRPAEAAADFEAALKLNPRFTFAWSNLGVATISQGRPLEALAHFERAASLSPDYAPAAFFAGSTLLQLGRPAEAVARLTRAVEIDPDYALAHFQLAFALGQVGRVAESEEHRRIAFQLDPNLARQRPRP